MMVFLVICDFINRYINKSTFLYFQVKFLLNIGIPCRQIKKIVQDQAMHKECYTY